MNDEQRKKFWDGIDHQNKLTQVIGQVVKRTYQVRSSGFVGGWRKQVIQAQLIAVDGDQAVIKYLDYDPLIIVKCSELEVIS